APPLGRRRTITDARADRLSGPVPSGPPPVPPGSFRPGGSGRRRSPGDSGSSRVFLGGGPAPPTPSWQANRPGPDPDAAPRPPYGLGFAETVGEAVASRSSRTFAHRLAQASRSSGGSPAAEARSRTDAKSLSSSHHCRLECAKARSAAVSLRIAA